MAVALPLNCHNHKPFFSVVAHNPNPSTLKPHFNRKHRSSLSISIKPLRLRTPITNGLSQDSDSDSELNNLQESDEENYSLGVRAALSVLRFYKGEISPLLPKSCRYVPTCSEYSMIAYKKYGAAKGSVLTVWRICRCNPLGGSGFDPPRWFDEKRPSQE